MGCAGSKEGDVSVTTQIVRLCAFERRVFLAHVASRHRGAFLVHTEHGSECSLFDGSVGLHHNTGKGKLNRKNRTCDTGVNISSACHVVPPPCWKKGVECTLPPSLSVVRTPMVAEFALHCIGLDIVAHSPPRIKYFLLFLSFLINSAPPTPLVCRDQGAKYKRRASGTVPPLVCTPPTLTQQQHLLT